MKGLLISLLWLLINSVSPQEILYHGSTPCHPFVNQALSIKSSCEFIKWKLYLKPDQSFTLSVLYGESQPNTNGFKQGGTRVEINGQYFVQGNSYHLQAKELTHDLILSKLDDNLLYFMDDKQSLLPGDGGFSFTLNRFPPVSTRSKTKPNQELKGGAFDGRTPCDELSAQLKLSPPDNACIKRKWRLILSNTAANAGTFELHTASYRDSKALKGTWVLTYGIMELTIPDHGTVHLQKTSDNVLSFLTPQK